MRSVLFLSHSIDPLANMIDPLNYFSFPYITPNCFPPEYWPLPVAIRRSPSLPLRASSAVRAPSHCRLSAGYPTISGYPTLAYPTRFPIRHSGYPTLIYLACQRVVRCPRAFALSAFRRLPIRRSAFPTLAIRRSSIFRLRAVGFPLAFRRPGYPTFAYPTLNRPLIFPKLINHSVNACSQQFSGSPGKYRRPRLMTIPFLQS